MRKMSRSSVVPFLGALVAMCALVALAPASEAGYRSKSKCGVSVGFHFGSGYGYSHHGRYSSGVSVRVGCGKSYYRSRGYYHPKRYHAPKRYYYPRHHYKRSYGRSYCRSYSGVNTYTRYGRVYRHSTYRRPLPTPPTRYVVPKREGMYGAASDRETQSRDSVVVVSRDSAPGPGSTRSAIAAGWRLLGAGRPDRAMTIFARAADDDPYEGLPKVGFALSSALLGDHEKAEWAMRRAMRIDPEVVAKAPLTDDVRRRLMNLAARYERASDGEGSFMLASMRYLLGEREAARGAIAGAAANGDDAPSTANLSRLLGVDEDGASEAPIFAGGDEAEEAPERGEVVSRSN